MPNDIAVGSVGTPLGGSAIPKKPSYLIVLEDTLSKSKTAKRFVTLDKPDLLNGFVQVKGFFTDLSEDEIVKNYVEVLTAVSKDLILEVMLPWHRIISMRSLAFKQK